MHSAPVCNVCVRLPAGDCPARWLSLGYGQYGRGLSRVALQAFLHKLTPFAFKAYLLRESWLCTRPESLVVQAKTPPEGKSNAP